MRKRTKTLIPLVCMSVLCGGLIAGNVVANKFQKQITNFLCGTGESFNSEEVTGALLESDKLCQKIEGDSIVLLKNNNNVLPLTGDLKVNVFGYGATNKGFLLKGIGSGSSTISNTKKVTFLDALEAEGFEVNNQIMNVYNTFTGGRPQNPDGSNVYKLAEPNISSFDGMWDQAKSFSDTALFVISRDGGENVGELPKRQVGNPNKTYLDITDQEQEMLNKLKVTFDKVVVVLNTTNTMHTGFLADDDIDAAINVGITGQSGAMAIAQVLNGTINPSGKTTDIMTYSPKYDPTFANNEVKDNSIAYAEDIYYGYKWYETADKEGFFSEVSNEFGDGYNGVVQYPFGYGLSYTSFSWDVLSTNVDNNSNLKMDTDIEIKVRVTNTGNVAGKDVVEVYYTPTYIKDGIEKAHVNLLDFAKTTTLEPGQSQVVDLKFSAYEMASYDAYDKNKNGHKGYEIDKGEILVNLKTDSHTKLSNDNTLKLNVEKTINFDKDPITGKEVKNRFTGVDAYLDTPIDGSTAGINVNYLSRSDFNKTFPTKTASKPNQAVVNKASKTLYDEPYKDAEMPTMNVDSGHRLFTKENGQYATLNDLNGVGGAKLVLNQQLFTDLSDYNSPTWDELLNQMSKDEIANIVSLGGFHTHAIQSIGKRLMYDYDGPAGFNVNSQTGNWNGESPDTESWTAYPSESLMGCSWNKTLMIELGLSMGKEANLTKINGWYAPGVNLHRSAYTARNYEYYSEDGVLSGKLAAKVIYGAKANGLYCYLKHLACSEPGPNPKDVNTWLTEQNLRENYLRPFEIAVKEGGANAIMTAFNRVGCIWAGANYAMNVSILREEWGFKGTLITDYSEGDPIGSMNVRQGVRGGNDLWLNPVMNSIRNPLDKNNVIDMSCARNSAKNIIYTMVDTWYFATNFDESELDGLTKTDVELGFKDEVFPWWIPVLIGIDVLALGGLVFTGVKFGLTFKKKEEE